MRRNRLLIGLAIAVSLGLIAGFAVYRQIQRITAATRVPSLHVVVAAQHVPLGTRLTAEEVRLVSWPGDTPMPGMFTRVEDCVGRAVVTTVSENEPILEGKLAPRTGGAGLSATIPVGMRALSIPVNDVVSVAGFVVPGTMVDVLVTGSAANGGPKMTRTILENTPVLAVGQRVDQDKDGKPQTSAVVTLLVSPEDSDRLSMAAVQGRIQLALRNTIDSKKVDAPTVLEAALFGYSQPALPSRPSTKPKGQAPPASPAVPVFVEIIYGNKREVKTFPKP